MYLKPAPGCTVYYENSRVRLPLEGAEIPEPLSFHWHRRMNDKDVLECDPPAAVVAPETPKAEG